MAISIGIVFPNLVKVEKNTTNCELLPNDILDQSGISCLISKNQLNSAAACADTFSLEYCVSGRELYLRFRCPHSFRKKKLRLLRLLYYLSIVLKLSVSKSSLLGVIVSLGGFVASAGIVQLSLHCYLKIS